VFVLITATAKVVDHIKKNWKAPCVIFQKKEKRNEF
jgi:hypothetical protein